MKSSKLLFSLIFLALFTSPLSLWANVFETAYEPAIPFYKSPESLFVSGYASKTDLLSQARQSYTEFNFEAAVGKKTVQVQNEQILREMDVAWKIKTRKATTLYSQPDLSSLQLTQLKIEQDLEIQSIQGAFARVQHQGKLFGYILLSDLQIPQVDPGVWTSLATLSLKAKPQQNSATRLQVPALSRVKLIKIQGDYGLFQTQSHQGYALLSEVIGRVDFADQAWNSVSHTWEKILYRNGSQLVVDSNKTIPLQNFSAFLSSKNRALISGTHPFLAKGTRVELVRPQAIRWTQSEVKGHGLVWWRRDLLAEKRGTEVITTAELLKRNLTGISYDSKAKKGLASAGGIFKTTDGKTWSLISSFGHDDWPVCLHPSGVWFVGPYKSTDEGKSFQPTLKFSELAKILQQSKPRSRAFARLKILDLKPLNSSSISMKIDTGISTAQIKSPVLSNQWTLLTR